MLTDIIRHNKQSHWTVQAFILLYFHWDQHAGWSAQWGHSWRTWRCALLTLITVRLHKIHTAGAPHSIWPFSWLTFCRISWIGSVSNEIKCSQQVLMNISMAHWLSFDPSQSSRWSQLCGCTYPASRFRPKNLPDMRAKHSDMTMNISFAIYHEITKVILLFLCLLSSSCATSTSDDSQSSHQRHMSTNRILKTANKLIRPCKIFSIIESTAQTCLDAPHQSLDKTTSKNPPCSIENAHWIRNYKEKKHRWSQKTAWCVGWPNEGGPLRW